MAPHGCAGAAKRSERLLTHPHPTRGLRERRPKTAEARASTSRRAAPASPPHHASPSPSITGTTIARNLSPTRLQANSFLAASPKSCRLSVRVILQPQRWQTCSTRSEACSAAPVWRRGSDAPGDLCHRFHLPRALARPRLVLGPRRAAKPLRATGQPRWGNLGYTLLLHTKILPSRDSSRWPWTSGPGRGAARGRAPSTLSPRRRLRVSGAAMASRRAPLARDMMDLVLIYTHTTQARGARAAAGPGP